MCFALCVHDKTLHKFVCQGQFRSAAAQQRELLSLLVSSRYRGLERGSANTPRRGTSLSPSSAIGRRHWFRFARRRNTEDPSRNFSRTTSKGKRSRSKTISPRPTLRCGTVHGVSATWRFRPATGRCPWKLSRLCKQAFHAEPSVSASAADVIAPRSNWREIFTSDATRVGSGRRFFFNFHTFMSIVRGNGIT